MLSKITKAPVFNRASTVSGGLNSVAYLGCATVNFAVGVILPKYS